MAFAASTACEYFVTLDTKDLPPHKVAIEAICPLIRIVKPTEFIAAYQTAAGS
ncbi:MAG TPA: hypothetical protein VF219_14945 [Vicinamibacterales bacterium]